MSSENRTRRLLLMAVSALGVALILTGLYLRFFTPIMPECNAVIRSEYHDGDLSLSRVIFISIVNINDRESAFIINGTATYNNRHFTLARTINMKYSASEGRFLLRPTSIVRRPKDDSDNAVVDSLFPVVGKDILFTVEKVNDKQYIFADNHSPNFICNRR